MALIGSCAKKDDSTTTTTLSAPTGLTATGGASQVALDWSAVSGASRYTVYWGNATGVSSSSTAITSVSTNSYTHTGLVNGTTYYYKVAAVDSAGTGTLSSEVNATTTATFTSTTTAAGSITVGSVTMSGTYVSACNTTGVAAAVTEGYFPSDVVANRDVLVVTGNDNISEEGPFFTDTSCSTLSFSTKDGNDNFTVGDASGEYYKVTYKETTWKSKVGTTVAETYYENYFSTNGVTNEGTAIDYTVGTEYSMTGSGKNELNLFYVNSTTVRHGDDDNETYPTEMDSLEMTKQ